MADGKGEAAGAGAGAEAAASAGDAAESEARARGQRPASPGPGASGLRPCLWQLETELREQEVSEGSSLGYCRRFCQVSGRARLRGAGGRARGRPAPQSRLGPDGPPPPGCLAAPPEPGRPRAGHSTARALCAEPHGVPGRPGSCKGLTLACVAPVLDPGGAGSWFLSADERRSPPPPKLESPRFGGIRVGTYLPPTPRPCAAPVLAPGGGW